MPELVHAIPLKDGGRPPIARQLASVPVGVRFRSEPMCGQDRRCRFCPPIDVPARVQSVQYMEYHV